MFNHPASHPRPASSASSFSPADRQKPASGRGPVLDREPTLGRIIFNAGQSTVACTILSLSETEAELGLGGTAGIPRVFKLATGDCGRLRACRVVSRDEEGLRVTFE